MVLENNYLQKQSNDKTIDRSSSIFKQLHKILFLDYVPIIPDSYKNSPDTYQVSLTVPTRIRALRCNLHIGEGMLRSDLNKSDTTWVG